MAELIRTIRQKDVEEGTNVFSFGDQAAPLRIVNFSGGICAVSLNTGADPVTPDQDQDGLPTNDGEYFLGIIPQHHSDFEEDAPAAGSPWVIHVVPHESAFPIVLKFQEI